MASDLWVPNGDHNFGVLSGSSRTAGFQSKICFLKVDLWTRFVDASTYIKNEHEREEAVGLVPELPTNHG